MWQLLLPSMLGVTICRRMYLTFCAGRVEVGSRMRKGMRELAMLMRAINSEKRFLCSLQCLRIL